MNQTESLDLINKRNENGTMTTTTTRRRKKNIWRNPNSEHLMGTTLTHVIIDHKLNTRSNNTSKWHKCMLSLNICKCNSHKQWFAERHRARVFAFVYMQKFKLHVYVQCYFGRASVVRTRVSCYLLVQANQNFWYPNGIIFDINTQRNETSTTNWVRLQ